ncbi:MAG TPA: hypothetical protein VI248_09860 [Kineosporiaceae bacterium]
MSTLTEPSPLPSRHAVRTLIEGLVGRDVELKDGDPVATRATNLSAVYVTDTMQVSVVIVIDIELAARLGGALGMLPRGGVDDAIEEGDLSGLLRDNTYEVLNVLAAVFNVENAPHVRLYDLYGPGGAVPSDVVALSQTLGSRMDLELSVAGYGAGRLSIITR